MEVKDRTLKESGSCPEIGRQQEISRAEIVSNRSSTFLFQEPAKHKMKRPNRVNRVSHNPIKRNQCNQQPSPDLVVRGKPLIQNLCPPYGDVLHYTPMYTPMCYIPTLSEVKASKNTNETNGTPALCSGTEIEERHIDVIVRIRPKTKKEEMLKTVVWKTSEDSLIFDPKEKDTDFFYKGKRQVLRNDFGKKRPNKNLTFGFDYVYGQDSTNEEIFDISLKGLISKVLDGFNCTVFAYGATGSGKTYTMLGSSETPGLTILMAEELFRRLNDMESEEFTHDIKVSYLEVYNETIKDLFNPHKELSIREDGKRGLRIPQLTIHQPEGPQELLRLLRNGNGNRSQHATDYNAESSRSHAVFEITVLMHKLSPTDRFKKRTATSRLFMVDLAGSEKGSVNIVDGMRQREGANINKSLLALSNCINALADGKTHIPYRNSKLTRLLKDSLSGNCVTVMIANISPGDNTFEDTHNTLHYANRAKNIKVACRQNAFSEERIEEAESSNRISDLQNEVRMLSQELADERRKHQATRELLECQVGDGDGFGNDHRKNPIPPPPPADQIRKKVCSNSLEIHDPVAVDRFVELLKQKIRLVKNLADTSVSSRLHEWQMNWKKVQVDIAEAVGRPKTSDTQHFIAITKLRNNQSDLEAHHPDLTGAADELQTSLKNINYEIENVHRTCLKSLEQNAPFVTVSFEEFLRHKEMDMEVGTMEKLLKFHQQLEKDVFGELKILQLHRFHLLQFMQRLVINLKEKGTLSKETETNFHALLTPVYDPCSPPLEPPPAHKRIDLREDFEKLESIFKRPVITFPNNEPITRTCSVLRLPAGKSSQLLPTTVPSSSSVIGINETSAKDTCYSSEEEKMMSTRSHKHGNNSQDATFWVCTSGGINCPASPQPEEDKENDGHEDENGTIPESISPSSIDSEDVFPSSEEETDQMSTSPGAGHQDQEKSECFQKLGSKREDNHQENNNMTPQVQTEVPTPHIGGTKCTSKDTRNKGDAPLMLHRGKATTDLRGESLVKSETHGKPSNTTRSLLGACNSVTTCNKGVVNKQKSCNIQRRIPRLIKKPPNPSRPYTFCYEDTTSISSFDSSLFE